MRTDPLPNRVWHSGHRGRLETPAVTDFVRYATIAKARKERGGGRAIQWRWGSEIRSDESGPAAQAGAVRFSHGAGTCAR